MRRSTIITEFGIFLILGNKGSVSNREQGFDSTHSQFVLFDDEYNEYYRKTKKMIQFDVTTTFH